MKISMLLKTAAAVFFFVSAAHAQNPGTVTNHAIAVGKGAGQTGFTSVVCGNNLFLAGVTGADPACRAIANTDLDADLAALANNSSNGLWARTGAGTGSVRTIVGPAAGITVSNGDGVAGNPTLALADDLAALEGMGGAGLAARTATNSWSARTLTAPTAGFTITNPAGVAGNPTFVLANDLAALEGLASTGIARRTGADVWSVGTAVSNAELATMAAFTFKMNATGSAAIPADVEIGTLTTKASPAASDYIILSDQAASGAVKKATISSIASAGSVADIDGLTGSFTTSNGITSTGNSLQLTAARRTLPTTAVCNAAACNANGFDGAGNYTTPANTQWIEVWVYPGGGGGGGSGTSGNGAGGTGGNSTFNTVVATGGNGGAAGPTGTGTAGGNGVGRPVAGSGAATRRVNSQAGFPGHAGVTASYNGQGGAGGAAMGPWGGGGGVAGNSSAVGGSGGECGGGGGGAGGASGGQGGAAGASGGEAAYVILFPTALQVYTYARGAGGTSGAAGTSGFIGGVGGAGCIYVTVHYGT